MKKELQNKLFEKWPILFRQKGLSMMETCMCWGIDCGDGWYDILLTLCELVDWHLEHNAAEGTTFEFSQIKEKYGTLTIYYEGGDEFIEGAVWMAERMSSKVCERCGKKGKRIGGGWVYTLCDDCTDKRLDL